MQMLYKFAFSLQEGNTPIHVACINGYVDVIELLIHIKADLNIKIKVRKHFYYSATRNVLFH